MIPLIIIAAVILVIVIIVCRAGKGKADTEAIEEKIESFMKTTGEDNQFIIRSNRALILKIFRYIEIIKSANLICDDENGKFKTLMIRYGERGIEFSVFYSPAVYEVGAYIQLNNYLNKWFKKVDIDTLHFHVAFLGQINGRDYAFVELLGKIIKYVYPCVRFCKMKDYDNLFYDGSCDEPIRIYSI